MLQLQALGKQLQEQAATATAVHGALDASGLLSPAMMTSLPAEIGSILQAEVEAGCMEPRVRDRITLDLQRRLLTWATEAHQLGHRLAFVEDTQLLQAVATTLTLTLTLALALVLTLTLVLTVTVTLTLTLLQAVAITKGALQQRLELATRRSNELQLQLSAERAEALPYISPISR